MSAIQPRAMSLSDFLDWEDKQPLRYEFDGFRPIAMTGGSAPHAAIQANLAVSIRGRLRGKPCQFYGSDLKIQTAGRIRYPDGFVVCTPLPVSTKIVHDPVVIFEVLSPSTASTDVVTKNDEYRATPSVMRYVILAQDRIGGTMIERVGADWISNVLDADSILRMPEIGVEVAVAELYIDVSLAVESEESEKG